MPARIKKITSLPPVWYSTATQPFGRRFAESFVCQIELTAAYWELSYGVSIQRYNGGVLFYILCRNITRLDESKLMLVSSTQPRQVIWYPTITSADCGLERPTRSVGYPTDISKIPRSWKLKWTPVSPSDLISECSYLSTFIFFLWYFKGNSVGFHRVMLYCSALQKIRIV